MSNTNTVIIKVKTGEVLSKEQKTFNRLNLQIESLNRKIKESESLLEEQLKYYHHHILPANNEIAAQKINIAILISNCAEKIKLSKTQRADFTDAILVLFNDAFQYLEPTPEQEAVYDKWSDDTYQQEKEDLLAEEKEEMKDMFNFFGIDTSNVDFSNPEDVAELQRKIKELHEQKTNSSSGRKKSKTQLKKEALQKETEAIQNKSIRDIYISLAKVLHPDSSDDSLGHHQKEELMKRLVNAYDKKDLPTLLALEMEWLHKQQNNIAAISAQKLNTYIQVLKERVNRLNEEYFNLINNPRYADLGMEVLSSIKTGLQFQTKLSNRLKSGLKKYTMDIEKLSNSGDLKTDYKQYVSEILKDFETRRLIEARNMMMFGKYYM